MTRTGIIIRIAALTLSLITWPLVAHAQQQTGNPLPWVPASRAVVLELQQTLANAVERFQALDQVGVLSYISDQYRWTPLTKAAIREQLRLTFAFYDALRAQVRIDEARTAGDHAWFFSTGDVSGVGAAPGAGHVDAHPLLAARARGRPPRAGSLAPLWVSAVI